MSKIITEEVQEREMAKIMKKLQDRLDDLDNHKTPDEINSRNEKAKQFLKDRGMFNEDK